MRFLFVFHRQEAPARALLQRLGVADVVLIVIKQNQIEPSPDEMEKLTRAGPTEGAACGVARKYRKTIPQNINLVVEPKEFRPDDKVLEQWLVPPPSTARNFELPSIEFERAISGSNGRLVATHKALATANDLEALRHPFAGISATLLGRLATGEDLGPMREWKSNHQVDFAANGPVSFKYEIRYGSERQGRTSQWHLKAGDRTSAEGAARIYFDVLKFSVIHVVVFHVGPHPISGEYVIPTLDLAFP